MPHAAESYVDDGIPYWAAQLPNESLPHSGLPPLAGVEHVTVFNATESHANGTYNHGPIVINVNDTFIMTWYNGPVDESSMNRVLLAASKDAKVWNEPVEAFPVISAAGPSGKGEQNEPFAFVNGRLYTGASDIKWGNSHSTGAKGGLVMRQVLVAEDSSVSLGEIFWLNKVVPAGFEAYGFKTYQEMDDNTRHDMRTYLASMVNETVASPKFNERSLYTLPGSEGEQLVLLLRGKDAVLHAASCAREGNSTAFSTGDMGMCVAGTGAYMFEAPAGLTSTSVQQCNWSFPVATDIMAAKSRTCAGSLPDGRIWVLGSLGATNRNLLTVSVSSDGLAFDHSYAINWDAPPIRYPGHAKGIGFQYPSGVWYRDQGYAAYSINKEDIVVTRFPLASLDDGSGAQLV